MLTIRVMDRLRLALGSFAVAVASLAPAVGAAEVVRESQLRSPSPLPSDVPAKVVEVTRGDQTSLHTWQMRGGMPAHLHRTHEEVIIVQGGHAETRIGDRTIRIGPGDVLVVRPGTVHGAKVIGDEEFYGISVFAPPYDPADRFPAPEKVGP